MSTFPAHTAADPTVADCLDCAQSAGLQRLDAQMIVLHALGRPLSDRAWLVAHDTDLVSASVMQQVVAWTTRRCHGEPLAYLTGHKEFFGLDLLVDPRVLVPRPDTETLVQWALDILAETASDARVLDLGTGSGAIALALKASRPSAQVDAVDASDDALAVAQSNAQRLQLAVSFYSGDWFAPLPTRGVGYDLVVSNPPYIADGDHHLRALSHEPLQALTAGADGLADIRHIVGQAPHHLIEGGWLLMEHGFDQAAPVAQLLQEAGFSRVASRRDLAGMTRCTGGQWPFSPKK